MAKDFDVEKWREDKKAMESRFREELKEKILQLRSTVEWQEYLRISSKMPKYSFNNQILLLLQNPEVSYVASAGFWRQEKNLVKKGEVGLRILAPVTQSKDDTKLEAKLRGLPEPDPGEKNKKIVGFHLIPVFDVSQTVQGVEWLESKDIETKDLQFEAEEIFLNLKKVASNLSMAVIEKEDHELEPGVKGSFTKSLNEIHLRGSMASGMKTKTLSHEIAHSLLDSNVHDYQERRDFYEFRAESVAYVVCQRLGIDTAEYSISYVSKWLIDTPNDEVIKLVTATATEITKTANQIYDLYCDAVDSQHYVGADLDHSLTQHSEQGLGR